MQAHFLVPGKPQRLFCVIANKIGALPTKDATTLGPLRS